MQVVRTINFKNKVILITGGTGSFGTTMLVHLLKLSPKKIIIFSRDELKQYELRQIYNSSKLKFIIGDIRDKEAISAAVRGVDYIFHAAALKQVPSCEFFPMEAIKTNVLGANNLLSAAIENNVKRLVLLSTDKAVYPINAMGMTKALMEKLMGAYAKINGDESRKTVICTVRYGNVLYSRGSVVPSFVQQIKTGKRLTVTDPTMTRFLLPLSDAVALVLHALSHGKNGSIYVKKAPAADLDTLATAVAEIFGYKGGYEIIGSRAGEKFHETLIAKEEWPRVVDDGEYYHIPQETTGFDYEKYYSTGKKTRIGKEGYTSENTTRLSLKQTISLLKKLPELRTVYGSLTK